MQDLLSVTNLRGTLPSQLKWWGVTPKISRSFMMGLKDSPEAWQGAFPSGPIFLNWKLPFLNLSMANKLWTCKQLTSYVISLINERLHTHRLYIRILNAIHRKHNCHEQQLSVLSGYDLCPIVLMPPAISLTTRLSYMSKPIHCMPIVASDLSNGCVFYSTTLSALVSISIAVVFSSLHGHKEVTRHIW